MYKFRLDSILNHRRYQEQALQKELAALKKNLTQEQNKQQAIKDKRHMYSLELQQQQSKDGTVSEIGLYLKYIDRLSQDLDAQRQRVSTAAKQLDQKRQSLLDMMKKRKTLDKLKEKGLRNYQQKMLKKERAFMDEVAANQIIPKI
jgi:flagellar FliJ protein